MLWIVIYISSEISIIDLYIEMMKGKYTVNWCINSKEHTLLSDYFHYFKTNHDLALHLFSGLQQKDWILFYKCP